MAYTSIRDANFWPFWLFNYSLLGLTIGLFSRMAWEYFSTGEYVNIGEIFVRMTPNLWSSLGVAFAVSLSIIGASTGIATTGVSVMGMGVRAPHVKTKNLISIIFCEASAVYGLIMAVILAQSWKEIDDRSPKGYFVGYLTYGSGFVVGMVNLVSALAIGVVGSGAALADGANPKVFIKILIVEIFASAISLFGLIIGVYLTSKL